MLVQTQILLSRWRVREILNQTTNSTNRFHVVTVVVCMLPAEKCLLELAIGPNTASKGQEGCSQIAR